MTAPTDLFASREKTPSVSFPTPGTKHTLTITATPELQQSKSFETQEKEFWPDGSPKKIILVQGEVNGVKSALWVTPGTALFKAIELAQAEAGVAIGVGGKLTVEYTHGVPSTKGAHFAPAKQYKATYVGASVFTQHTPAESATPPAPVASAAAETPAAPAGLDAATLAALAAAGLTPEAIAALKG